MTGISSRPGVRIPPSPPILFLAVLPLVASGAACVERVLLVRTEPPGARIALDGEPSGVSPVEIPFEHHGLREVTAEREGFAVARRLVELSAPWTARFPFDLLFELALPLPRREEHAVDLVLEPLPAGIPPERAEEVLRRAESLRRWDPAAADPVEPPRERERP